eukprot:gene10249-17146_t
MRRGAPLAAVLCPLLPPRPIGAPVGLSGAQKAWYGTCSSPDTAEDWIGWKFVNEMCTCKGADWDGSAGSGKGGNPRQSA